jgi:hypothetical protein
MGSCHVSLIYAIMRKNRFNMATCVTKNYRSNALRDHMHLDIILTQLYVRCIPILSTLALSYPIIRTSLYTDPMHFDIILTLIIRTLYTDPMHFDIILTFIIRTLYTDPMHFDIILTQLYVRRCIPILCTLTLYLRSLYVRCIPILCTSTLYLLNYTYVIVYRSYALRHYTYVHYTYVVYRSYAL